MSPCQARSKRGCPPFTRHRRTARAVVAFAAFSILGPAGPVGPTAAQVAPSTADVAAYRGLHAAAAAGNVAAIRRLLRRRADPNERDAYGRTPCHVAAYFKRRSALSLLLRRGCDPNALEQDRYDIATIAGVADDPQTLRVALAHGARATNVTSRYDGTALIASSHLGHGEVVRLLVDAGAPLDHVNNLGWTALLEAIILGDGGTRHTKVVRILLDAGADPNLADRQGVTPFAHATRRGYAPIVALLQRAGAHGTA